MGSAAQSPDKHRPMETIKEELTTALTKRAMKLKSETEPPAGGAATEHAEKSSTDDARDLTNAAQVILKGDQKVIRNLCRSWRVQLKAKKISPHGNHQAGAQDGVDKACNEAEE